MIDDLTTVLIVFAGVFMIVALRYIKLKSATAGQMSAEEAGALARMSQIAERLERRVATLEQILDQEAPAWRSNPANLYQRASDER